MDIDAVFLYGRRPKFIFAFIMLLIVLAALVLPLALNPEIIRYIPESFPRFGWGEHIAIVIFLSGMIVVLIIGRRQEHVRLRQLHEATVILHAATPRPVMVHLWWMAEKRGNILFPYCSLRPADVPETSPARVVELLTYARLKNGKEMRQAAEWFADPAQSKVEVLRFADGTVVAALPVEEQIITMPPPPRSIPLMVRVYLRSVSGLLFVAPAIVIFFSAIIGMSLASTQLGNAVDRLLPFQKATGWIIDTEECPRCHGVKLVYRYGENAEGNLHTDDETAFDYLPGTRITVEYIPYLPDSSRVVGIPRHTRVPSRGEAITLTSLLGLLIVIFIAGIIAMVRHGHRRLCAFRTYSFGLAMPTAVDTSHHPLRPTALTLCLRDAAGVERAVKLSRGIPAHWMRDMSTAVFYDPDNLNHVVSLKEKTGLTDYVGISTDGHFTVHPYGIATMLMMAVMTGPVLLLALMFIISG